MLLKLILPKPVCIFCNSETVCWLNVGIPILPKAEQDGQTLSID